MNRKTRRDRRSKGLGAVSAVTLGGPKGVFEETGLKPQSGISAD